MFFKSECEKEKESQTTTFSDILKTKLSSSIIKKKFATTQCLLSPAPYLYKLWPGKNKFYCNGFLMSGPNIKNPLIFVIFLIVLWFSYFFWIVPSFNDQFIWLTIIQVIISFIGFVFYFLCIFCEPGIIPKRKIMKSMSFQDIFNYYLNAGEDLNETDLEKKPFYNNKIILFTKKDNMKDPNKIFVSFCDICKIYRGPLTKHCK